MNTLFFEIVAGSALLLTSISIARRILSLSNQRRGLLLAALSVLVALIPFAWYERNILLQWVWIEGTTLAGALLVATSPSRRSLDAAWKFLLINSLGLGIALFGMILMIFGLGRGVPLDIESIRQATLVHPNWVVEIGLWLTIYGYAAKLGLFPNHFWVSDTYSESPPNVAALLSGFLPLLVAVPLRGFVDLDFQAFPGRISAAQGLLVMSLLTLLYSIFTLKQVEKLSRLAALTAMFHGGMLGAFLYLDPSPEFFLYLAAGVLVYKSVLFFACEELRTDRLRPASLFLFLAVFLAGFGWPLSPFFVSDLVLLKFAMAESRWILVLLPVCGVIFACVGFVCIFPHFEKLRTGKRTLELSSLGGVLLGLLVLSLLGFYGFACWDSLGGLGHA